MILIATNLSYLKVGSHIFKQTFVGIIDRIMVKSDISHQSFAPLLLASVSLTLTSNLGVHGIVQFQSEANLAHGG
jgi:hypothetical protein